MRVLVVSNTPFLPADAGNRQRINRILEHLAARGFDVGMLLMPDPTAAPADLEGMAARLSCFEVARPPAFRRTLDRVVGRMTGRRGEHPGEGVGVDDWCPGWFRARAAAVARTWRADAVMVVYVFLSGCLEEISASGGRRPLGLIDTQDVMHQRVAAYAAAGLAPQWFTTSYEEERRGLMRADVILAINEADATTFRQMVPGRTVLTVAHAETAAPAPLGSAAPARLLFVASYNDMNVSGLNDFFDRSWPLVRAAVPGVELVVCGSIASKLSRVPPGVIVRGFVASLTHEYACARVVINPVPAGTGLKVKVVEALCHGRPVVSSRNGAESLCGEAVVTTDDPVEFAGAIRRLCLDDALWRCAAAAAAEYAARTFSPDAAFRPLVERLRAAEAARS